MNDKYADIKVVGFDADDTLWINEPLFRNAEAEFCQILSGYDVASKVLKELYRTEMENLKRFGYGIKGFTLSMIETALRVSNKELSIHDIEKIINISYEMMDAEVVLLEGVEKTLANLKDHYRLVLVTKGDLFDQEKKLNKSGLAPYFHHIEIVSEKKEANYTKLIEHLDIQPKDFLMVGNSAKSDIIPVLNIGSQAIHIPFHTTWVHEEVSQDQLSQHSFQRLDHLSKLVSLLT